ncbi:MAG: carbonic anhydrase [Verrucomicrobia bacterium]|nr:carbonic anhydrase [Verrucomicrobiota bacterium]
MRQLQNPDSRQKRPFEPFCHSNPEPYSGCEYVLRVGVSAALRLANWLKIIVFPRIGVLRLPHMHKYILAFLACFSFLSAETVPEKSLRTLMEGNARYSSDKSLHPDRTSERRLETAQKQEPFAAIVGCSDSRVAPEILFDQGIGDLFIVRVAGNVVGPLELDSVEYSVVYLHSSLVVVLGHENCGAVQAAVDGVKDSVEAVMELIEPAVKKSASMKGNRLENAIKTNVQLVVNQLRTSPKLAEYIDKNLLKVVGGYYNFHTGKVQLLPEK